MVIETFLEGVCKPLLVYGAVMAALITYNITQVDIKAAGKNTIFLAIGGIAIFALCSSGFEIAAWILLTIPPFFFVALVALLIITQVFKTTVNYDDGSSAAITGQGIEDILGLRHRSSPDSYANGRVDSLVGKPYVDACDAIPVVPKECSGSGCHTCA
jgi:hypothetical protein